MLNFECKQCRNDILVETENIGDVVKCPTCDSVEIVPDIPLPSNFEYAGYRIDGIVESDHLWTKYRAKNIADPKMNILLKIPTSFFLKHITDFNSFVDSVIRNASLNISAFPKLLDRSVVRDKIFFAYDYIRDTHNIAYFAKIDFMDSLHIIRNIAIILQAAWDKNYLVHQNLTPDNIRLTKNKEVRIQNMGISDSLIKDHGLLDWGFDIWDKRYMSPEFITEGRADTPSCDIYSLGGIMFLLITGHHPFERVNPKDIYKVPAPNPLQYNPRIPEKMVALYYMMTEKKMEQRINSWDTVIQHLDTLLGLNVKSISQTQFVPRYEKKDTEELPPDEKHFVKKEKKRKVFHNKKKEKEKSHKRLVFNSDSAIIEIPKLHNKWKKR